LRALSLQSKVTRPFLSAIKANTYHAKNWGREGLPSRPPYDVRRPVKNIQLKRDTELVRVHLAGNARGSWMMRRREIEGLTPQQIKNRFALPTIPTHVSIIRVPAGTKLLVGAAGAQTKWGRGGGLQFELRSEMRKSWIISTDPLK
jgi:hypothetical protein